MGRRIEAGKVGSTGFGNITFSGNTIAPIPANTNVTISPTGTGLVEATKPIIIDNDGAGASQTLRFQAGNSTNYVAFKAATTVAANVTWTLPATDGASGQVLTTDAAGVLSWSTKAVAIADQTSSSSTYYPLISSVSSSTSATTLNVTSTRLTFVPSSGLLTVTALTESSSIALKENVNPIANALDSIMQLVGVVYDRKDGTRYNEAGLIAEEVVKVIPNVVTTDKDGNPEGVQYTKLTAYLIEAVKSLKAEINELKGMR